MQNIEYITLNNGVKIPCIGNGPGGFSYPSSQIGWLNHIPMIGSFTNKVIRKLSYLHNKRKKINSIAHCLKLGYLFIDYSSAYGNEDMIRKALKKSGLKREDVFLISRAANKDQFNGQVRESFMKSLKAFGVDYFDLYMFHWPVTGHFIDTYKEMEKLYKEGLCRSIGVCNCHQHHLQEILDKCTVVPAVNEFEVHPLFTQKPLIEFCKQRDIQVIAYTPLARNDDRLRKNLILQGLGKKYNKTIAQIILRWDIQQGIIPIPRSSNYQRQASNIDIFDFELTNDEMKAIDSININSRLRFDPDNLDFHSVG